MEMEIIIIILSVLLFVSLIALLFLWRYAPKEHKRAEKLLEQKNLHRQFINLRGDIDID